YYTFQNMGSNSTVWPDLTEHYCIEFFNLYTLAMPVLSTLYFAKMKRQRTNDIRNHLNARASNVTIGNDGWANYSTMIQKQWK
ncbi:hypothetical protein V3C99_007631, partial [Haemonchus contortus]|uniref:PhoLip_ATPase_C domain-containing protein n=1 Tax=Haemonchus contortus TaxID=6289 RepID=A0A7I4YMW9_HAECO